MNFKSKNRKKQEENLNIINLHELIAKAESIKSSLKAFTWRDLETKGKFTKDDKLTFISEDMLILGCDVGSEKHYIRAIDSKGIELSNKAFPFSNSIEGFNSALDWAMNLAAKNNKKQVVMGLEPTGHYWFVLATWMISNGVSVLQVNPYAVKQTKEIEDNSQHKDDRKDPKVIANLVKNGNYGVPYLPEGIYAELRGLTRFREQLVEDRIREINRLHREMKIYFPEYREAFGKIDGVFNLELLKNAPFPEDILEKGEEKIKEIWHNAKLRGRGYSRLEDIIKYAKKSAGLKEGVDAHKEAVKWYAQKILELNEKIENIEKELKEKVREIPYAENILEVSGIGENMLAGVLSEIGDISRFDNVKEIQKLSGLSLVSNDSGKHNGQTKISRRGRKRLRYWLFQMAKSVVGHAEEFKELHLYYTTRDDNPLKKMQSLVAVSCKILRVIYAILTKGVIYSPEKMRNDIKRVNESTVVA